jgi:hypothetical protein
LNLEQSHCQVANCSPDQVAFGSIDHFGWHQTILSNSALNRKHQAND